MKNPELKHKTRSLRYAVALHLADNGYPERYARLILGQNSKVVRRAYAEITRTIPSLSDLLNAIRKRQEEQKNSRVRIGDRNSENNTSR